MSCRFPGARSADEYWSNLRDGIESIRFFSDRELRQAGVAEKLLRDPHYVKANGYLDDIDKFDAGFFGLSPREASIMDPQHRFFLECSWEALEHAGHDPSRFDGSIGVFAGSGMTSYMMYNLISNPDLMHSVGEFLVRHTGNDKDFLTTRASYLFNLRGPSINVQTACSTSLVAVHLASQQLLSGECDMALVGGVTIQIDQEKGYLFQEGEILSPDGHCRAFDSNAQGTVFGSGVGVVVLRRLEEAEGDGNTIHAVIRGSAVNNDGAGKVSYLAPSVDGQAEAIVEAIEISDVDPETVTFIEAHGTGTPVGDPIEMAALKQAYGRGHNKTNHCAVGSVKTNIGHLDTAAGVASLMKATLAVKHGEIPPTLHFQDPNPKLEIEKSPFFVNNTLVEWKPDCGIRRAGISSLGVGGTNAHVLIEEPSVRARTLAPEKARYLLPISARSATGVSAAAERLAVHLSNHPDASLADVAHTLDVGRRVFDYRTMIHGASIDEVVQRLSAVAPPNVHLADEQTNVVFMFAGGGAQYRYMGADLYERYAPYRDSIDACIAHMSTKHGVDLRPLLVREADRSSADLLPLQAPMVALPALFATEYALAQLLMSFGIRPAAMTGHSMGEYVAACLAGVFSLADALSLVYTRGRLFETLEAGSMLSVLTDIDTLERLLPDGLDVAARNADNLNVVAGPVHAIEKFETVLNNAEIDCQRVKIDVAAHSRMVEPILAEFSKFVSGIRFGSPQIPFVSNVTGDWITASEATDPQYWVKHIRNTVRFSDGIATIFAKGNSTLLEVGPGKTLATLANMNYAHDANVAVTMMRHPKDVVDDDTALHDALCSVWSAGVAFDLRQFNAADSPQRVPLPTYPFEKVRHWISPGAGQAQAEEQAESQAASEPRKVANIDDWIYEVVWRETSTTATQVRSRRNWLVLAGTESDPDATELLQSLNPLPGAGTSASHVVRIGNDLQLGDQRSQVRAGNRADFVALFDHLASLAFVVTDVVHAWPVSAPSDDVRHSIDRNFFAPLYVAQAAMEAGIEDLRIYSLTRRSISTGSKESVLDASGALVAGPSSVIEKEIPTIRFQHIDLDADTPSSLRRARVLLDREPSQAPLAIRDNRFFGPSVDQLPIPRVHESSRFRRENTYVITGGTGGIGLALADLIGSKYAARVVLIGRQQLPPRADWTAAVEDPATPRATRDKLTSLLAVSSRITVDYIAADVQNSRDLEQALQKAAEAHGPIHGILHAAGVLDDGPSLAKTEESALAVLLPKTVGARNVIAIARRLGVGFVELFSSTSAVLAPPGQVDYVSANAFMNALANAQRSDDAATTTVDTVNWGMWRHRGMTATTESARSSLTDGQVAVTHEFFHAVERTANGSLETAIYSGSLNTANDWYVNEHRLWSGQALAPGTLIVEYIRAAHALETGSERSRITDLIFAEALSVPDGRTVPTGVGLRKTATGAFEATVFSVRENERIDHAFAEVSALAPQGQESGLRVEKTDDIRHITMDEVTKQERWLAFGPRWKCLRTFRFSSTSASAELSLSPQYRPEAARFGMHPALLDLATGFALALDSGFESTDDLYVPISYADLRFHAPLTPTITSEARLSSEAGSHPDFVTLDYRIRNADGDIVVAIDGFAMKRVRADEVARVLDSGEPDASAPASSILELGGRFGIEPAEGLVALERCLTLTGHSNPIVSSIRWDVITDAAAVGTAVIAPKASGGEPSERSSEQAIPPRDDVERSLVELWESLLGESGIGIRDDFFGLGGHSLIAVRLFTKIRRQYGVDLSLATLFQAPTIEKCAELIRDELGLPEPSTITKSPAVRSGDGSSVDVAKPVVRKERTEKTWSPLVPIQTMGTRIPFYCVHGAGGNVLNFRSLSQLLGPDQPFYGLQARGVDGVSEPASSIEEMASDYTAAILAHNPNGPFLIGGYSGGGVVAYEIAQVLERQGKRVLGVIMLDTFCPSLPTPESATNNRNTRRHLTSLREAPVRYLRQYAVRRFRYERNRVRKAYANILNRFGRPLPIELREFQMITAYHAAQNRYQPETYNGTVILFAAEVREAQFQHVPPDMGWAEWVENLEIVVSAGDHDTLFQEPHVGTLVAKFREIVDHLWNAAPQGDGGVAFQARQPN